MATGGLGEKKVSLTVTVMPRQIIGIPPVKITEIFTPVVHGSALYTRMSYHGATGPAYWGARVSEAA